MTARTARALICGRLDSKERPVIVAMIGAGGPIAQQDLVVRAWRVGGLLRQNRYRRAVERLRRDGVLEENEEGLLVIAEPDRWIGRISARAMAVINALDGPASPLSRYPLVSGPRRIQEKNPLRQLPLRVPGPVRRAASMSETPRPTPSLTTPKRLPGRCCRPRPNAAATSTATQPPKPRVDAARDTPTSRRSLAGPAHSFIGATGEWRVSL
jgi:hypothetical protein